MVYVMSDIHGHYAAYVKMLEAISFSERDSLYIIGDVIDRGMDGIKILRHVMERGNITLLRGNHEQIMLDARTDPEKRTYWVFSLGGGATRKAFRDTLTGEQQQEVYRYLEETPLELHIEVDGLPYHLIHGRPSRDNKEKLRGRFHRSIIKRYPANEFVLFGHTPTIEYQNAKPMRILFGDSGLIGLDCGCAYGESPGRLGCLRLNDWKEFYIDI